MSKCSFCQENIEPGTGKLFVTATGRLFWFCSSKCERNMLNLKRKPVKLKWTLAGQASTIKSTK